MSSTQTLITKAYSAFNHRDIDSALVLRSENVSWPKASEGGRVSDSEVWHVFTFVNGLIERMDLRESATTSGKAIRPRTRPYLKHSPSTNRFDKRRDLWTKKLPVVN